MCAMYIYVICVYGLSVYIPTCITSQFLDMYEKKYMSDCEKKPNIKGKRGGSLLG